jgi:outer membrane protein assembly factor BamB
VYILGTLGDFHCISQQTHQPVWKKNLITDFDCEQPRWAFTQAPALYGETVILAPVSKMVGMVALAKDTGKILWKTPAFAGNIGYSSPVVTTIGGVDQVLFATSKETVGVNARSGEILWRTGDWQCKIPIASPSCIGDGRVFVTGGYNAGAAMFHVVNTNGTFTVSTLYKTKECNGQIHQPVLYQNHLYLNGNDKSFKYGLMCMNLEGKVKWQTGKNPGFEWGGLLLADDRIYTVDGPAGDLCMVKPVPTGYQEMGRVRLLAGKEIWATIALSNGKLLLRDQQQLKCVNLKDQLVSHKIKTGSHAQ